LFVAEQYPFDPNAVPEEEEEEEEHASASEGSDGDHHVDDAISLAVAAKRQKTVKDVVVPVSAPAPARSSLNHVASGARDRGTRISTWQLWTPLHRRAGVVQRRFVVRANHQR
jgi:hypothetical protein